MQSIHEELESSTEKLKSSNEEMQSVNEELQSTNEELETSKEELQSVNEELATVNAELQTKVLDLSQANNDMNNLLAGTGIGTVFVNHQLRILRFTPAASTIINLIQSDVGRPVDHITSNLVGHKNLVAEVQAVLRTLVSKEQDVQTTDGKWYAMRIQPYRTLDNVIEGAVISFLDITEMVRSREALQESERRYHSVVLALSEGIILHARNGSILTWNKAAEHILGLTAQQMRERIPLDARTIHEDGSPFLAETRPSQVVFRTGEPQLNVVMGIYQPNGTLIWISSNAVPVFKSGDPQPASVVVSFSDITERKQTEDALRQGDDLCRMASAVRDAVDAIVVQDMEGGIIAWNPGAARMYGWSEAEALRMNVRERMPEALREGALLKPHQLSMAEVLQAHRTQRLKKDGTVLEISLISTALLNETGQIYAVSTIERAVG